MASDGQRVSSSPSISSFAKSHSVHSSRLAPSTIKTVITAPPWARDEPPSPGDDEPQRGATSSDSFRRPVDYRVSDVTSYESSIPEEPGPSRWWTFARHRPSLSQTTPLNGTPSEPRRPQRDWERSLSLPWLTVSHHLRSQESSLLTARPNETEHRAPEHPRIPADPLHVDIPPPPDIPYTIAQNATPGWDTPWTARPADLTSRGHNSGDEITQLAQVDDDSNEKLGTWTRRRKRVRAYMMYNPYVPLLFRFINIVFTTTALAIAIRIRLIEKKNGVMGAVGCSPTLVIIFASLTLVHVMIAIYVEYFGRPVGLWHTSSKLAYTLIEVVFICAWSAALALSFDNFFTSLIPCASASDISWYNQLPRPTVPGLTGNEGTPGDQICDDQLALICLVGVGLIMYCINLVISLFRIFERVKYHPTLILPS